MSTTTDLNKKTDIALVLGDDKIYDYEITEDGDFLGDEGFDTSILQELNAELKASEDEQPKPLLRRGSTINENPVVSKWPVGSKLWFYDQARATVKTRNGAADEARNTLRKYVPQYLKDVKVIGTLVRDGVRLEITLVRLSGKIDKLYYDLWDKTGS